jgi:3-hydroxyisobutyrate dehydrogenase-like beta-hydroxyacid dehydrogenase
VLGTGQVGAAVAHVLLTAGFTVRVWSRSTEHAAAVVAAGAIPARTPAEAVTEVDVVMPTITGHRAVASEAARAGRLLVLAVGAQHARERVQPIFDTTVWASNPADARHRRSRAHGVPATELGGRAA